jgi:hypothetical protein
MDAFHNLLFKLSLRPGIDINLLGSAIKELASVTGAKIHVSSPDEVYPGTNDRSDLCPDACNNPHQIR